MNGPLPTAEPAFALTLQLLEWISERPRSYRDVIDAWRTTCPRLSIWEDACGAGLIDVADGSAHIVVPSERGRALLRARQSAPAGADR